MSASFTSADVSEFQVAKLQVFTQDTASAPTTPDGFMFDSYIDMFPGDAASVTVSGLPVQEESPGSWTFTREYASQAAIDSVFPGSMFPMHIQGGALGTLVETLVFPTPAFYPLPPALTAASFNASQGADPTEDLLIEWNTPGAGANAVFLAIHDVTNDTDVIDDFIPFIQTSFLIPASQLSPNTDYEIEIAFANMNLDSGNPAPGFGISSDAIAGYASITSISFTTGVEQLCDDVEYAGVVKISDYEQVADDTAPFNAFAYSFGAFSDSIIGGIATASVSGVGLPDSMIEYYPGSWDYESADFGTKLELDTLYPSSMTYMLHLEGGALGVRDQGVTIGVDDYPTAPYLVETGYSSLQMLDTTQDLSIEWASPTANVTQIIVDVYNLSTDTKVIETQLAEDATSILLVAGTLQPEVDYELVLNFVAAPQVTGDVCPGFGTGSMLIGGYISATTINFTTLGTSVCLADLTGDGLLNFFDISLFLQAFNAHDLTADFNGDELFNFFDISAFLVEYSAGCP